MTSDFWHLLRARTPARIGLVRHGEALSTRDTLELAAAHAAARDAVHHPLDVDDLVVQARTLGLGDPVVVRSEAVDRATYLTRPDLGRRLATTLQPTGLPDGPDLVVVLADGLSARAVQVHAVPLVQRLVGLLPRATSVAAPVIATQARVALGDHVGQALGASMVLVLVGERPGLTVADSLGCYLTWAPRPGMSDSQRNCVSNVRAVGGLDLATAARTLTALMEGARRLGATGTLLKDDTAPVGEQLVPGTDGRLLIEGA